MIPVSIKDVNHVVLDKQFKDEIDSYVKLKEDVFDKWLKTSVAPDDFIKYAQTIRNNLSAIVYAEPEGLYKIHKVLFDDFANTLIKRKKEEVLEAGEDYDVYEKEHEERIAFKDWMVYKWLNYGSFRDKFLRKYFHGIGIKACVYCNANWALTVEQGENEGSFKAKYQVDHFWPKAIYPCFAISLFNFIPSCANCNLAKSNKFVNFTMYTDDLQKLEKSAYSFGFKDASLPKKLLDPQKEELKFEFRTDESVKPDLSLPSKEWSSHDETFDITGIYDLFGDIAEEICIKAQTYTEKYRQSLIQEFPTVFGNKNLSDRIILGNYATDGEIHKRPLSKFMQDIAKEVGLIC